MKKKFLLPVVTAYSFAIILGLFFGYSIHNKNVSKPLQKEQKSSSQIINVKTNIPLSPSNSPTKKIKRKNDKSKIVYGRKRTKRKIICLTFDDGPNNTNFPMVLDVLKKYNVKANFFLIGSKVRRYSAQIKRADKEGHLLLNHTWDHVNLSHLPQSRMRKELLYTKDAIGKAIGKKPLIIRPPYGSYSKLVVKEAKSENSYIVLWTHDTKDYQKSATWQKIFERARRGMRPGSIILMHTNGRNFATVKALPQIIMRLRKYGYQFVTLDELLDVDAYEDIKNNLPK